MLRHAQLNHWSVMGTDIRTLASAAVILAMLVHPVGTQQPAPTPISVSRLKDVTTLQGAMVQPLIGYGLVVGLNKTGDRRQTIFSAQTLANMLERFGVAVPPGGIKVENIAAVMVTAEIGPYAQLGARLDIMASSIGDARSLQGGTLLPTPLRGPDGSIVALAQGPLSIGGFGVGGGGNAIAGESPDRWSRPGRRVGSGRTSDRDGACRRTSSRAARPRLRLCRRASPRRSTWSSAATARTSATQARSP